MGGLIFLIFLVGLQLIWLEVKIDRVSKRVEDFHDKLNDIIELYNEHKDDSD